MRTRPAAALAFACAAASFLSFFAASQLADAYPEVGRPRLLVLGVALGSVGLALLALGAAALSPPSPREALGLCRSRIGGFEMALLALGLVGLSQLLDLATASLSLQTGTSIEGFRTSVAQMRRASDAPVALTAAALGLVALPALAEELLFRGWMLRALLRLYGRAPAVLGSALLFGMVHQDWAHGASAAVLGLYLGGVALASGSVWPAMLCHLANNALALAAAAQLGSAAAWFPAMGVGASTAALLVGLGVLLRRRGGEA